jgi:hypothetical protein
LVYHDEDAGESESVAEHGPAVSMLHSVRRVCDCQTTDGRSEENGNDKTLDIARVLIGAELCDDCRSKEVDAVKRDIGADIDGSTTDFVSYA